MMPRPEIAVLWVLTLSTFCYAGPINRQASDHNSLRLDGRNQSNAEQNVCVNDDVLYQPGDLMPAPTPCARCVCSPPGSLCTPVACEKRPGCKALQRPNQCCPEYQCECEQNGRLYANGERLDNAENPCQACYCQGGEVVCTTVECYRRDDCEPQFVLGRCCPKYDHCPPLVMDEARYDEPFISGDRPQHTRATFQPSSGLEGDVGGELSDEEDDQVLGASNVQERVHIPASGATTDAPTSATDVPAISTASPAGDAPHDAAINIHVPAEPWTDTIAPATTRAPQTTEEGSGATEAEVENAKSGGEPVVDITERVSEDEPIISTTDDVTTVASIDELDTTKEDVTETRTEEPITRLFMLSKEAELDPTTVSAEYTDIPDEMSTTPEVSSRSQETTVTQNEDLATEATTLAKESTTTTEASTDSSPEFKDFDEWSASKSSEFLRDSSSTGSSGGFPSTSDSHSKPSSSASDESTSHFLASSINTESVKPSNDGIVSPHSESTDSNESSDSSEETVTGEIDPSTEKENSEETTEKKDLAGTKLVEIDHVTGELKIDEPTLDDRTKDEENKIKKRNEQPDIVLDTEATDENGPPVLLIGDDLANHQMDIIVATSSTEEAETENPHGDEGPELRDSHQETTSQPEDEENATDQSETTEQPAKDTDEAGKLDGSEEVDETHTEEPSSAKGNLTTVPVVGSSTEKQAAAVDVLMDIMMSDDPLPGQADSAEIAKNEEDLDKILGKTGDKYDGDDDDSTTVANKDDGTNTATNPDDDKADDSVNSKIDLQTESPEHESTTNRGENEETVTNTDKEDGETTLEPKYENTVVPDVENLEHKKDDLKLDDNQYGIGDKVIQRRADEAGGDNDITDDQTTTETEENFTTTEYSTSERPIAETVVPNAIEEKEQSQYEETTETKYTETQTEPVDLQEQQQSDTEQKEKSHEEQSKDITTLEYETTTDIPTTQNSPSDKISNFANDDIMLGDQPQSGNLAFKMQSTENKEKSATKNNSENVSDKHHTIETEQTTEIEDRVDLVEDTTTTQDQESDFQTEISHTTITEINTESATTQEQKTETANEAKLKENDADEESKDKNEENVSDENTQAHTESDDEPLRILVHSANADKEDESTTLSENTEGHSEEFSTPPPVTTSSDDSVQDESVTTQAEKDSAQEDVTATEGDREEATTNAEEHQTESFDTGVKINPEVLELKPLATAAPKPATNATDTVADHDITTLSPQWLKTDNDSKEEATSGHDAGDEKQEDKEGSGTSAEVTTSGAPIQTVTEHHESEDSENKGESKEESNAESKGESLLEGDGVNDGKEQQRVERRVDETDKKDLFLLEDFFTKLYRHQIATDTNKEH